MNKQILDNRFMSRDPSKIDTDILEDLICRFLINLPKEEKQFPRLMFNIREACYFYADNYFTITKPTIDKDYEKKFAKAIFENWSYLRDDKQNRYIEKFDSIWKKFMDYIGKIPSYGAIIFNQKLDKILFNIYFNMQD